MDRRPVVEDRLQEGVFAQFARELDWYWTAPDDLAHLTGVGMAAPPGEEVTDNHQVRPRRARRALARRHCRKGIGGVGLEAFAFPAGLVNGPPGALCGQLEAVDEGNSRFRRKSTAKADHAEAVAPMAEMAGTQLLAMEVAYVGIGLAVFAGYVAQLPEVRAPRHLEQLGFSTGRLGLCLDDLDRLKQGQLPGQKSRLGVWAVFQASRGL
jgi:hypothetical protein